MDFGIIQKLARCIVRPPKAEYQLQNLVPPCFEMRNRIYERQQFSVVNNRGMKLQGTLIKDRYSPTARDTIIFLHANGSCRLVMKNYIDIFLQHYDMVSFDFAGCGHSEGEFITLGYAERQDVYSVINYIKSEYNIKNIVLWGRSMGAATAVLYAAKYGGLKAIISDNSYSDLEQLVNQLSDDYLPFLPTFLLDGIINSIQQYIENIVWKKENTDFNLRKLKPINSVQNINCPIFYVGSIDDTFVNVNHTKALYNKTKTIKRLQLVKGNHNEMRTKQLKQKIFHFLKEFSTLPVTGPGPISKPSSAQRVNIFKQSSAQKYKMEGHGMGPFKDIDRNIPSHSVEVGLVNCAELEFQSHRPVHNLHTLYKSPHTQGTFGKQFSSASSNNSSFTGPQSRETIMSRMHGKVIERSRSKIKRKKIFEGIDFINEHFNGDQI